MEKFASFFYKVLIITILFSVLQNKLSAKECNCTKFSGHELKMQVLYMEEITPDDTIPDKQKSEKPKKEKKKRKSKKVSFETFEENYNKAIDYYDRQLFLSAAHLFEELYPLSIGTPLADTILFLFADCYYQNRDYELAAFHYKEYVNRYSGSDRAEKAHFYAIKAIAQLSPDYSLDQTETYYAIEEITVFTQNYPSSQYMTECNELLDLMRDKLAKKDFEILKLYYNTENYKSAQIMAANFFKKYSYSQYADDAYLILVKNNYEYAKKSVAKKQNERYEACIEAFNNMQINYSNSSSLKEAKKYADEATIKIAKNNQKEIK